MKLACSFEPGETPSNCFERKSAIASLGRSTHIPRLRLGTCINRRDTIVLSRSIQSFIYYGAFRFAVLG